MIQIAIAILAGVLTVASPCILPLLPILLGVSIGQRSKTRPLFIVAGFVLVFSVAAILLSVLTRSIGLNPNAIRAIGSAVLGIFGILMLWPTPFELLMLQLNRVFSRFSTLGASAGAGNLGGFILGMTLGVIWTPCAGPVLASVLTLVALQRELAVAAILLVAYAIGAGIPMLVIAYGGQYLGTRIAFIAKYARALQVFFGLLILLLSVAIYFNYDVQIYSILLKDFPGLNPRF